MGRVKQYARRNRTTTAAARSTKSPATRTRSSPRGTLGARPSPASRPRATETAKPKAVSRAKSSAKFAPPSTSKRLAPGRTRTRYAKMKKERAGVAKAMSVRKRGSQEKTNKEQKSVRSAEEEVTVKIKAEAYSEEGSKVKAKHDSGRGKEAKVKKGKRRTQAGQEEDKVTKEEKQKRTEENLKRRAKLGNLAWEILFGEGEVIAVNMEGSEDPLALGLLSADVLVGDGKHTLVEIEWYEPDDDFVSANGEKPMKSPRKFYLDDETDMIPVGSMICSLTGHVDELADRSTVKFRADTESYIKSKLEAQLADGYDSGAASDVGDASFAKRVRARARIFKRNEGRLNTEEYGDESDDESGREAEERKGARKRKRSTSTARVKKSSGRKPRGAMVAPRPDISICPELFLERTGKIDSFEGDAERACKEVVRCVRAKDVKGLKAAVKETKLASLNMPQCLELPLTPLHWAILLRDKAATKTLLNELSADKMRPPLQKCSVATLTSGRHTSKFADYRHRQVNASRGGREGNNAFIRDMSYGAMASPPSSLGCDTIFTWPFSGEDGAEREVAKHIWFFGMFDEIEPDMFDMVKAKFPSCEQLDGVIDTLVLHGARSLAHHLISINLESYMGFNFLHSEALGDETNFSKEFRASSVVKMSGGRTRFTPVHCAAINPNTKLLEALLAVDPGASNSQDMDGHTLMHYAASCESDGPLRFLFSSGSPLDRDARSKKNVTPLMIAAKSSRRECVRALLDISKGENGGGDVSVRKASMLSAKDRSGFTPLHWAVLGRRSGNQGTLRALIDAGADVNAQATAARNKQTPLHLAVALGDLALAETLLGCGAQAGAVDKLGRTTAMLAAKNGHIHILSYLLNRGVDPNAGDSSQNTALTYAIAYGWVECADLLIRAGADVNAANAWNTSPLQIAIEKGRENIATKLLNNNDVDLNFRDNAGKTLLLRLIESFVSYAKDVPVQVARVKDEELLKDLPHSLRALLSRPKVKIGIADASGRNELHAIADASYSSELGKRKSVALARRLMDLVPDKAAFVEAADENGVQPLLLATKHGNVSLLQFLIEAGADLGTCEDAKGQTLLHHLCRMPGSASQVELLKLLFEKSEVAFKKMCGSVDAGGFTPLLRAAVMVADDVANSDSHDVLLFVLDTCPDESVRPVAFKEEFRDPVKAASFVEKGSWRTGDLDSLYESRETGAATLMHIIANIADPRKARVVLKKVLPKIPAACKKALCGVKDAYGLTSLQRLLANILPQVDSPKKSQASQASQATTSGSNDRGLFSDSDYDDDDDDEEEEEEEEDCFVDELEDDDHDDDEHKEDEEYDRDDKKQGDVEGIRKNHQTAVLSVMKELISSECARKEEINSTVYYPFESGDEAAASARKRKKGDNVQIERETKLIVDLAADENKHKELPYALATLMRARSLAKNAGPNWSPRSLVHEIILKVVPGVIRDLHKNLSLDLQLQDQNEDSLLHLAVRKMSMATVSVLLELSPGLKSIRNKEGLLPLHIAVDKDNSGLVTSLLTDADLEATDANERTPLIIAVGRATERASDALVACETILLERGADVSAVDKDGRNALHHAFLGPREESMMFNFPHGLVGSSAGSPHDPIELVSTLCNAPNGNIAAIAVDKDGRTPLHYAAAGGGVVSCLLLQKRGAALVTKDKDGNSPLALSILRSHVTLSIMLIKSNSADLGSLETDHCITDVRRSKVRVGGGEPETVKVVSRRTKSCFWHATMGGFEGLVYVLLDEFPYNKAIADALDCGSFKLTLKLLSTCSEAVIHAKDPESGMTHLHRVASVKRDEPKWLDAIVEVLIKRKIDLQAKCANDRTALHYAAVNNHLSLCKMLMSRGLEPSAKDRVGLTPFLAALQSGNRIDMELLSLLLKKGNNSLNNAFFNIATTKAKPATLAPLLNISPGPNAETIAKDRAAKAAKQLAQPDVDTSCREREIESTPAVEAVKRGNFAMLLLVAAHGADIDAKDGDGFAPIHHAVLLGDIVLVHALARLGANLDQRTGDDYAIPPILMHVVNGKAEAVRAIMLSYGADPRSKDANGETALHVAVKQNDSIFASSILRAAAEVVEDTPAISQPDLVKSKGKEMMLRFGRCPIWFSGVVEDEKTVRVAFPGYTPEKTDDENQTASIHKVVTILHSTFPNQPKLSVPKLVAAGIDTVEKMCRASRWDLQKCVDATGGYVDWWSVNTNLRAAVEKCAIMFPPQRSPGRLRFPTATLTGIIDADEFDTEATLDRFISAKANHLTETERAELRLKYYGAEGRMLERNDTVLTSKFNDGEVVLTQDPADFASWHQGTVVKANRNGTYDVSLLCGPIVTGCMRMRMRPCRECLRLDVKPGGKAASTVLVNSKNSAGKTPLDLLLQPFDFGSFENEVLAANLVEAGATITSSHKAMVRPGSALSQVLVDATVDDATPALDVEMEEGIGMMDAADFEKDLKEALIEREEMNRNKNSNKPPAVSKCCELKSAGLKVLAVAEDGTGVNGFFDVVLTKVDVRGWPHGVNNFYKMQIVQDTIKDIYILINNWGRIGDHYGGKHQQTPFSSRDEVVAEFDKVFRSKTGNAWADRASFVKHRKKYRLVNVLPHVDEPGLPKIEGSNGSLPDEVRDALIAFTDPDKLKRAVAGFGLDMEQLPIGRLNMATLLEATEVLQKIRKALEKERSLTEQSSPDIPGLLSAMEEVAELSSRFYEIIPTKENDECIKPLNLSTLGEKVKLIHELKDLTVASQVVIAASHAKISKEKNALEYCLNAVGAALEPVRLGCLERTSIEQYFRNTRGNGNRDLYVRNVFRVGRAAASAPRMDIGNHRLLWHGTSTSNMMGILRDGLRIAPPEAPQAGMAFGRGIYCADMFEKSFHYCRRQGKERAFLLLVEVALGKENKVVEPQYMEQPPEGFHSTVAVGARTPDPAKNVFIRGTGINIPLGELTDVMNSTPSSVSWKQKDGTTLSEEASAKINAILADPETEYPVEMPGLAHQGHDCTCKIELGPWASEILLLDKTQEATDMEEDGVANDKGEDMEIFDTNDGDAGTDNTWLTFQRVSNNSTAANFQHSEYIVYDESQVTIRYILEVDSMSSLQ